MVSAEERFCYSKGSGYYPHVGVCVLSSVVQLVRNCAASENGSACCQAKKIFFSFSECKQAVPFYFRATQLLILTKGRMQEYAVGR